jgi:4-phospho-D-threonate 3-dehydrogenase / 4-phospho-D-erythronate 3-dehydrogenase
MSKAARLTKAKPSALRPILAVTMGDAAGIGPELCLRLLAQREWPEKSIPLVVGDARILERVGKQIGVPLTAHRMYATPERLTEPAVLDVSDALAGMDVKSGTNQASCGKAAARYIQEAVRLCLSGACAAMVTAPISKRALALAGVDFPGHTEMIASQVGSTRFAMMLYSEKMAVAFATLHQSLRSVPGALTAERLVEVGTLLNRYLVLLRDKRPRLAVLGLNPHAGEEGLFGDEEQHSVVPAVQRLCALGVKAEGPVAPDVAFTPQALARYDGHVTLYHDQGGIPFKMVAFDTGVNVTMGLGIIRTSPDHGTAFDIAWKGEARPDSFLSAYALAARLTVARDRTSRRLTPIHED